MAEQRVCIVDVRPSVISEQGIVIQLMLQTTEYGCTLESYSGLQIRTVGSLVTNCMER